MTTGSSKQNSLVASQLHRVQFFLIISMTSSMRISNKLLMVEKLRIWLLRDAGLCLKTSAQFSKWCDSHVSGSRHSAKGHAFHSLWVSPGLCDPTLPFFLGSPKLRCLQPAILYPSKEKTPLLAFLLWIEAVSKLRFGLKWANKALKGCREARCAT